MFRKALSLFAFAVLLAPAAHAASVDEVLAKHFEANGGLEKLKSIKTMRVTGKMAIGPGMEAPFTMERARPNKQRLEFTFSGMTGIQASDGEKPWMVMPFMGKKDPEPIPAEDAAEMLDDDFDGALVDWKTKGNTVEMLENESVEGADCFKLRVTKKNGKVETMWIDTETYLTLKSESKRKMRGTEVEAESYFSDYKDVDGMLMAHTMEQGAKGAPQRQKMMFEKIELNVALDDARFKMPAAAPAADKAAPAKADEAKKDGGTAKKDK